MTGCIVPREQPSAFAVAPARAAGQEAAPASGRLPQGGDGFDDPFETYHRDSVELALSDESFWVAWRAPLEWGDGELGVGLLGNEDDDYMINARLLRFGTHQIDFPVRLGVGIAAYAGWIDTPDVQTFALALQGGGAVEFDTAYPSRFELLLAVAPGITTFDDGDGLIDALARYEVDLSQEASAFIGYRFLEADLEDLPDREIDDRINLGVRIGF